MSKQQRDAIDAALRAEPFSLSQSTAEHRKSFDAFAIHPYPADVVAVDVTLGGVAAIELSVAGNGADPAVLYFHGGGYVAGSARTGTHLAAELARRTGGRALSVDYRLAPEHPYPAAVEDGLAAYAGLLESGVSPAQIAVAGESAGGGLAVGSQLAGRVAAAPEQLVVGGDGTLRVAQVPDEVLVPAIGESEHPPSLPPPGGVRQRNFGPACEFCVSVSRVPRGRPMTVLPVRKAHNAVRADTTGAGRAVPSAAHHRPARRPLV
jgi:hypothetical protein